MNFEESTLTVNKAIGMGLSGITTIFLFIWPSFGSCYNGSPFNDMTYFSKYEDTISSISVLMIIFASLPIYYPIFNFTINLQPKGKIILVAFICISVLQLILSIVVIPNTMFKEEMGYLIMVLIHWLIVVVVVGGGGFWLGLISNQIPGMSFLVRGPQNQQNPIYQSNYSYDNAPNYTYSNPQTNTMGEVNNGYQQSNNPPSF